MCSRARAGVLPGVEIEAVERAGGGEKKGDGQKVEPELRQARDGGDEDGGREEDADGELFGETVCAVAGQRARVDDEEPCAEQRGEDAGGDRDDNEEGAAMAVVEAMALFELRG